MAKEAFQNWVDSGRQRISTTQVPGTPWTISISGETITSKIRNEIYESVQQYGHHKFRNTGANWCQNTLIDRITFGKTMTNCDDNERQFRTKHMVHISATGINMKRRQERDDKVCPWCGVSKNNTHIHECTIDETTDIFETHRLDLEVTIDLKGVPGMSLEICELLRAARSQTEPNFDIVIQHEIKQLAQQ